MSDETRERVKSHLESICGSKVCVDYKRLQEIEAELKALREINAGLIKDNTSLHNQLGSYQNHIAEQASEIYKLRYEVLDTINELNTYKQKEQEYYEQSAAYYESEAGSEAERGKSGDMRDVAMVKAEKLETEVEVETEVPF